jgi:hypothetical protein
LARLFSHVSKPIYEAAAIVHKDSPEKIESTRTHLEKLTSSSCTTALLNDDFTTILNQKLGALHKVIGGISLELARLKSESKATARMALDKPFMVSPNPENTYGADSPADFYVSALAKVQAELKLLNKAITLVDRPYDYLLSLCSISKNAAFTFGLSKAQHRLLIMSFIPSNTTIYKDLQLLRNLEDVFYFASINSGLIKTKAELESSLDQWRPDFSSYSGLQSSLTHLRTLHADLTGRNYEDINITELYIQIHRTILKQKLPAYMLRDLNDLYPRIESSTSALELHSAILSCLAPGVGKVRSEKINYPVTQVNQVTAVSSDSLYNNTGSQNQNKNQNNNTGTGTNSRNKNQNHHNQQNRGRSRSRGRNQSNQGNQKNFRGRSRSKSTGKPYFVKPWPKNEPYLTRDKKSFLPAFEEHFKNFCYRCGLSNHSAKNCRIYPEAKIIMELCGTCCMGLHDRCKSSLSLVILVPDPELIINLPAMLEIQIRLFRDICYLFLLMMRKMLFSWQQKKIENFRELVHRPDPRKKIKISLSIKNVYPLPCKSKLKVFLNMILKTYLSCPV